MAGMTMAGTHCPACLTKMLSQCLPFNWPPLAQRPATNDHTILLKPLAAVHPDYNHRELHPRPHRPSPDAQYSSLDSP
jgi:hypothetical protein